MVTDPLLRGERTYPIYALVSANDPKRKIGGQRQNARLGVWNKFDESRVLACAADPDGEPYVPNRDPDLDRRC